MVLHSPTLEEKRIEALRRGLECAIETFHDLALPLTLLGRPVLVEACLIAERGSRDILEQDALEASVAVLHEE
jgi:hypothetical protein